MQLIHSKDICWKECHLVKHWLISNTGLVYTTKNNKLLSQTLTGPKGKQYLTVSHRFNGQVKHLKVHRLVATLFCRNPNNFTFVNHLDGDKLNNNDWNLEWTTPSGNAIHAIENGLNPKRGEDNHNSLLTNPEVIQIRSLYQIGVKQITLSKFFGVDQSVISKIVNNKIWKHATAS